MKCLIGIIAGEPYSVNSEIIAKAWMERKKLKNIFIIGNYSILKKQFIKLNIKIPLVKIATLKDFKREEKLFILDVPLKFKTIFKVNSFDVKAHIFKCFDVAHKLAINKKILGFINASVDKKIFDNKYLGVTEYLSEKNKSKNKEVMMIHNKELSVVPLTTHVEIKNVTSKITFNLVKDKIITLDNFYFKLFKKRARIAILGLNPHNSENEAQSIENRIIKPAVIKLKKLKIDIKGPFPADTAFGKNSRRSYDVIVGMYHDQVLGPFKALYGYEAINLTLGLRYIRISPDHGTAQDIVGLNRANPRSLINAINFLNKIND
jgi:4-hydroxy-L-threonine phosphate dehydrogenase PdxA